ncbi:MAG: ribose 5-phosphate isomerase B [Solirubrobacterales bacterium]
MKISIASDHGGFALKSAIGDALRAAGHEVEDFGTDTPDDVDYPDFAEPAAREVATGGADLGVIVCGSGVGVAIVANKVDGVRAVNAHSVEEAQLSRQHNHANVVTLGGRLIPDDLAIEIVNAFIATEEEGGRHDRRVDKIAAVERKLEDVQRA